MIGLRSDSDIAPILHGGGVKIAKFGLVLVYGVLELRNEATYVKFEPALGAPMKVLSPPLPKFHLCRSTLLRKLGVGILRR